MYLQDALDFLNDMSSHFDSAQCSGSISRLRGVEVLYILLSDESKVFRPLDQKAKVQQTTKNVK